MDISDDISMDILEGICIDGCGVGGQLGQKWDIMEVPILLQRPTTGIDTSALVRQTDSPPSLPHLNAQLSLNSGPRVK